MLRRYNPGYVLYVRFTVVTYRSEKLPVIKVLNIFMIIILFVCETRGTYQMFRVLRG